MGLGAYNLGPHICYRRKRNPHPGEPGGGFVLPWAAYYLAGAWMCGSLMVEKYWIAAAMATGAVMNS